MADALAPPKIGDTIEIEHAGRQLSAVVHTTQELGNSIWRLVVVMEGYARTIIVAPDAVGDGWEVIAGLDQLDQPSPAPPPDLEAALAVAHRVMAGKTLHGPATRPLRQMAEALLHVTSGR